MDSPVRSAVRLRPRRSARTEAIGAERICVFTSLDGTLLDARTFEPGASREAVRRLRAAGTDVIPVSVMTLEEMAPLASELGMRRAMIVEAGGAIARWKGDSWTVEPCGPPAETLLDVIADIEDRSGARLLVYTAMEQDAAARTSGRSGTLLEASTQRRFSEPFVLESGDLRAVQAAARELGFSVRPGRRFLHLCRTCDEGEAFVRVRQELECEIAIAVGGTLVDAEFMSRADVAIAIPGEDGKVDPELLARIPGARIAPEAGPAGWVLAVTAAVAEVAGATKKRTRRVS